jgi:hypothetical protein
MGAAKLLYRKGSVDAGSIEARGTDMAKRQACRDLPRIVKAVYKVQVYKVPEILNSTARFNLYHNGGHTALSYGFVHILEDRNCQVLVSQTTHGSRTL